MELNEAIRHILDGNAVLFAGSGFSAGAIRDDGSTFSTATPLAHKLLKACGYDATTDNLWQAADLYMQLKGEVELANFVRNEFTAVDITPEQRLIGSLPWKRIYTTNYDNVVELACQKAKHKLESVTLSNRVNDYRDKTNLCIHLNGRVSSLTGPMLSDELKLTGTSYLTDTFKNSQWISLFQTDLKTTNAIVFVGYSMQYDLDIKRLIYTSDGLKEKTFFVLWEQESEVNRVLLSSVGTILPIGVKGLADAVMKVKKDYIPQSLSFLPLICFKKCEIGNTPRNFVNRDASELFFKGCPGSISDFFYSLKAPDLYPLYICRTKIQSVMNAIRNGEKNVIVHSSLGNGKTIFLQELAALLTHEGYRVYIFQGYRTTIGDEMEQICKNDAPTAILFDRYADRISYLETLNNFRTNQVVILTERTSTHEIQYVNLPSGFTNAYCVDLNRMDNQEVNQLVRVFNHYGLWGTKASLRDDKKFEHIANNCHRSMCRFILSQLKSKDLLKRYSDTIEKIRTKDKFYDAIIFILIAHVSEFDIDIDVLVNSLDASQLNSPAFRNDPVVKEFIDFNGSSIRPMSSIVASVLLSEIVQTGIVVDVMINVFRQLNSLRFDNGVRQILRNMIIFSNLQHILNINDTEYKFNLKRFYETIRPLEFCYKNPHFWLQYAILKLSEYDYKGAEIDFGNAYSYAEKIEGFDTYQIDNHHSRFILENEMEFGSQKTCMEAFKRAHSILIDPKHRESALYYPYRVAQKYYPFYEKYYKGMNKSEKQVFVNACETMLSRCEWYISNHTTPEGIRTAKDAKTLLTKIINETM